METLARTAYATSPSENITSFAVTKSVATAKKGILRSSIFLLEKYCLKICRVFCPFTMPPPHEGSNNVFIRKFIDNFFNALNLSC